MEEEIFTAAREGNEGEVLRLLGADPTLLEVVNEYGDRPLIVAATHGHLGVVTLLAAKGADIHAADANGMTAIHQAAYSGHDEVAAFLLSKGAQPNTGDESGRTAFIWASARGHLKVVKMIAKHLKGQGLNQRRAPGAWSALGFATYWGKPEVVQCLLLEGADDSLIDEHGRSLRDMAEEDGSNDGEDYLIEARPRVVQVLDWWEGELERRALLCRATCLHKAYTTQRDLPTSQVPTYLEARVAAGHAVPVVEVVSPQELQQYEENVLGKRKAAGEGGEAQGAEAGGEETRHAVLEYVVKGLNEALLTELLEGFHCGKGEGEQGI